MMQALLLAALWAQDVEVTGRAARADDGFQLEVRGKGPGLVEGSLVGLRFQRRVNRVDWAGRTLATAPHDQPWGRAAYVQRGGFVHAERCAAPGEAEVEVRFDLPGGESRSVMRIFRTAPIADSVTALGREARRLEGLVGELRDLAVESAAYLDDPCARPRRGRELARRLALRMEELRDEERRGLLTGSIDLLATWAADLQRAVETRASGKGGEAMRSALSGEPHTGEQALLELREIEEVMIREQALFLVREAQALREEIDAAPNARSLATLERPARLLAAAERAAREGSPRFLELSSTEGNSLAELVAETLAYLDLAAGMFTCPASVEGELASRRDLLARKAEELESWLRKGQ